MFANGLSRPEAEPERAQSETEKNLQLLSRSKKASTYTLFLTCKKHYTVKAPVPFLMHYFEIWSAHLRDSPPSPSRAV
jgi:hypothetical protein